MLAKVLARLARIQEFDLSLGRWASYPRKGKQIIYAAIRQPSVSRLSIQASEFDSFPDLASLLIYSPGLKYLVLANLVIHDSTAKLQDTSHLPVVQLECLRIDTHLPLAFSDPAFPIKVDRLRQLRLNLAAKDEAWKLLNQLIKKTAISISHLELSDTVDLGELIRYTFRAKNNVVQRPRPFGESCSIPFFARSISKGRYLGLSKRSTILAPRRHLRTLVFPSRGLERC